MRKLIVSMNLTIDGYLSGPDCELDWHFECWTKQMGDTLCSELAKADTILLGRVTYTAMSEYWTLKAADPSCRGEDFAFANMMNSYSKIVFSKTIHSTTWNNTKLMHGNLLYELKKMKQEQGKNIIVYGSSLLVDSLVKYELVDEYQLWLHPVVLGKGKRLFKKFNQPLNLHIVKTEQFNSGVLLVHYEIQKSENKKISGRRKIFNTQF